MDRRLELHDILCEIMGDPKRVYFQPKVNIRLDYPCIVYSRDTADSEFADNRPYKWNTRYQVVYIDRKPDNDVIEKLIALPMCRHDRSYVSDDLHHDSFNLYF